MPNCFQLIPIGSDKPAKLQEVDDLMAKAHGSEPHPDNWYHNWYNIIGLRLACGSSLDQIEADFVKNQDFPELIQVVVWLKANYKTDAFYSVY